MLRAALFALLTASRLPGAANDGADVASVQRKIDAIREDRLPPGAVVRLRAEELNAYLRSEAARIAPEGVSGLRLELGRNRATGYASIDFPKLRQSMGRPMGALLAELLAGERPVRVDAHLRSANGSATVFLDRVEVSGLSVTGVTLDLLIRKFLWVYYPRAKIGEPFELAHRIDRIEVRPAEVRIVIAK
jgi:hypothetical protein